MFYRPKCLFREPKISAGHIKVLGGRHVARRPDVAQSHAGHKSEVLYDE